MEQFKPIDRSHWHICPACNGDGDIPCEEGPHCDDGLISCPYCRTLGVVSDTWYDAMVADGMPETPFADEVNPYDASK